MSVKDKYELLKKKHHLPDFKEIDNEFELKRIDEEEPFLLRAAIDRINEKLDVVLKLLTSILQPETSSFSDLYECKVFNEDEKKRVYALYKKIMVIKRTYMEVFLKTDEKREAEFIKKTLAHWHSIKKEMLPLITKMKHCWEKEPTRKEALEYLG